MKIFNSKSEKIIIGFVIAAAIILFLSPFDMPYNIKTYGKIVPAKEWILAKGPDGRLMTSLVNYKTGTYDNYTVTQFQRGDAVEFSMGKNIAAGTTINKFDTVANIYSNETEKKLSKLKGDLATEKAVLQVSFGTEKQSVIDEQKRKVEYAKRQLSEQEKLFTRDKALFEKELISKEDYDISEGAVELFKINVRIAEEKLNNVITGAKSEQINLIRSRINGLENEIDILYDKFSQFILTSPLSGIINRSLSRDTLLVISDTTEYLVVIPVELEKIDYIKSGQEVNVKFDHFNTELSGEIFSIDNKVRYNQGNQYFLVFAEITDQVKIPLQDLRVECTIACEKMPPRDHLFRFINNSFN